jgi:hypothetical protein
MGYCMTHREYVRSYLAASIALISMPTLVGFFMGLGMANFFFVLGLTLISSALFIFAAVAVVGVFECISERLSRDTRQPLLPSQPDYSSPEVQ